MPDLAFAPQDAARRPSGSAIAHMVSVLLILAIGSGCAGSRVTAPTVNLSPKETAREYAKDAIGDDLGEFSTQRGFAPSGPIGCRKLFDSYCSALYSPRAAGNLRVPQSEAIATILQGETRNNFPAVYVAFARAKLKRQSRLPADFQASLGHRSYFSRLKQILSRKARAQMSVQDRLDSDALEHSLASDWTTAYEETTLRRLRKNFPEYHSLSDLEIPIEWQIERRRVRRALVSEVATALWNGDPNWSKVEKGFQTLRESFLELIDELDAPPELRNAWRERIDGVELVLPGSRPSVADDECVATKANAYYYSYLNLLTVCAGDFNGEDILQTLAHEMAHSLDLDRSRYLYQASSPFGRSLARMRKRVCDAPKEFSCKDWTSFKSEYPGELAALRGYALELPEFNRCLARRSGVGTLSAERARSGATHEVRERLAELASSDYFLRIVKERIPLPSGKLQKNPNYLNPCSYYMWSNEEEPIDDGLSTLIFFTAEYRCTEGPDDSSRLRQALAKAQEMSVAVVTEAMLNEGEFSSRRSLEIDGLASSPAERFADVVGSHALSRTLAKMDLVWERRNAYLASSSWQCERPGLASSFPTESAVQREWELDAHSEGRDRIYESFSAPVREALLCEKDFDFKECALPLRPKARHPVSEDNADIR